MTTLFPIGSLGLCICFVLLCLLMAVAISCAFRTRAVVFGVIAWLLFTGGVAASGWFKDFSTLPPHLPLVLVPALGLTLWLGCSSASRTLLQLPLALLIGFQAFRILVELLIHRAVDEGVAPGQMTWTGMNFDILTGITALMIAPLASRLPRGVLLAWNIVGLGLLIWVVGVAVLSMPTVFQRLYPSNTWVAFFPFVWLPTILVPCALLGHVVLFRRLAVR